MKQRFPCLAGVEMKDEHRQATIELERIFHEEEAIQNSILEPFPTVDIMGLEYIEKLAVDTIVFLGKAGSGGIPHLLEIIKSRLPTMEEYIEDLRKFHAGLPWRKNPKISKFGFTFFCPFWYSVYFDEIRDFLEQNESEIHQRFRETTANYKKIVDSLSFTD